MDTGTGHVDDMHTDTGQFFFVVVGNLGYEHVGDMLKNVIKNETCQMACPTRVHRGSSDTCRMHMATKMMCALHKILFSLFMH